MAELKFGGVKVEPVGTMTIERVAHDGATQSVGMRTVHAQLVRATGQRPKFHPVFADKAIFSYPFFTPCMIHHLIRTIHRVGQKWEFNFSRFHREFFVFLIIAVIIIFIIIFEQSDIHFSYFVVSELSL